MNSIQWKINNMNWYRLDRLANWLWKRYEGKTMPPIAHDIVVRHHHWEEYNAGLL